jgi:hypothetical protein
MARALQLLAPHEQRFVTAILQGLPQGEAYKVAKFPRRSSKPISDDSCRKEGHRQVKKPRIAEALARAQASQRDALAITVDDLVAKLEVAYDIALASDPPQCGGAVSAVMGIGKLLGLVVDRAQIMHATAKPSPVVDVTELEMSQDRWLALFGPPGSSAEQ